MADQSDNAAVQSLQRAFKVKPALAPAAPPQAPTPAPSLTPNTWNNMELRDRADAAKARYMKENGLDENGDPVK